MSQSTSLVVHDLLPAASPVRAMLRRVAGDDVRTIDGGTRLKPLLADVVLREIGRSEGGRVFAARNAQPLRGGIAGGRVRSLIPVFHPILQTLRLFEQRAVAEAGPGAKPTPTAIAERMAAALRVEAPRYPFATLQSGFYSAQGQKSPRGRPVLAEEAGRIAESLADGPWFMLPDFPAFGLAGTRAACVAGGIPVRPSGSEPAGGGDPMPDLAAALAAWRDRLPDDVFRTLCEINAGDLVFLDTVVTLHAERLGLDADQRAKVAAALDAAAEVTGHRRAERVEHAKTAALYQARPASLIEPDPVLGWRNRKNARDEMLSQGRRILLDTDEFGARPVAGRPEAGEKTLAVYGCSHAFGWGVQSDETVTSVLQAALPTWRVENHCAYAYGTVHNYLALQRAFRWEAPDYVCFTWAAEHRIRNIADVRFILSRTPRPGAGGAEGAREKDRPIFEMTPRAMLDAEGNLVIKPVTLPRPDLVNVDLGDFTPDPYYLDLICLKLLEASAALVREAGGHFFVAVLVNSLSPLLSRWLAEAAIPVVEATLPSREYTNLPDDHHPNPAGHRFYAERILDYLAGRGEAVGPLPPAPSERAAALAAAGA